MKFRTILLGTTTMLASLALAVAVTFNDTRGSGRAADGDGVLASFEFEAHQALKGDNSKQYGRFRLEERLGEKSNISLRLASVTAMSENLGTATFFGPGVYRVASPSGVHEYKGSIYVSATSNGHPDENAAPDTLTATFTPTNPDGESFSFSGSVTKGDIAVATTQSY